MTETRRQRRHRLAGPDHYPALHPVVIGRRVRRGWIAMWVYLSQTFARTEQM